MNLAAPENEMFSRLNVLAWLAGATALSLSLSHSARAAGDPVTGKEVLHLLPRGQNYRNAYPDYSVPELRHQHAAYIVAALHEYKSGERPHPTMHAQAFRSPIRTSRTLPRICRARNR